MIVLKSFLFFVGWAGTFAHLLYLCLWVDMRFVGHDIPELSLTEIRQGNGIKRLLSFSIFSPAKMYELRVTVIFLVRADFS